MEFVQREALRARLLAKYGPSTVFLEADGDLYCGMSVDFDPDEKKIGGHLDKQWARRGVIILLVDRDDGPQRVREYWIESPPKTTVDGRIAEPAHLYKRLKSSIRRHGGLRHEDAA